MKLWPNRRIAIVSLGVGRDVEAAANQAGGGKRKKQKNPKGSSIWSSAGLLDLPRCSEPLIDVNSLATDAELAQHRVDSYIQALRKQQRGKYSYIRLSPSFTKQQITEDNEDDLSKMVAATQLNLANNAYLLSEVQDVLKLDQ